MSDNESVNESVNVKVYCDWQIFGDVDPQLYVEELLRPHLSPESSGGEENFYLVDFDIAVASIYGPHGLRYVQFSVVTPVTTSEFPRARDVVKARLDRMVGDTDVNVLWVERA